MSDGTAGSLMHLAQAFDKGLARLFRHLEQSSRKLKPGEIDYSMAEIYDTPYRMQCPSCHQACWSFERHVVSIDSWRDEPCKVVPMYSKPVNQ